MLGPRLCGAFRLGVATGAADSVNLRLRLQKVDHDDIIMMTLMMIVTAHGDRVCVSLLSVNDISSTGSRGVPGIVTQA